MCSDQIDQLNTSAEKLVEANKSSKRYNVRVMETYARHLKEVILCLHHYFKKLQMQFGEFLRYNQLKRQKILRYILITIYLSAHSQSSNKPFTNINHNTSTKEPLTIMITFSNQLKTKISTHNFKNRRISFTFRKQRIKRKRIRRNKLYSR